MPLNKATCIKHGIATYVHYKEWNVLGTSLSYNDTVKETWYIKQRGNRHMKGNTIKQIISHQNRNKKKNRNQRRKHNHILSTTIKTGTN